MADPFGLGAIYDDMKYLGRRAAHSVGPDSDQPYKEPSSAPPPTPSQPPAGHPGYYAKGVSKVEAAPKPGATRFGMLKKAK